jgi:hypothetical protein
MWVNLILGLKDIGKEIKSFRKKEREDLADLLNLVGDLLLEIADAFEGDEYPYTECATIETMGNSIVKHMTRFLKKENRKDVAELFEPFESLRDEWERRHEAGVIEEMRSAAGEFKGFAALFKL